MNVRELFTHSELRLFRHTAVLFSFIVLGAVAVLIVWLLGQVIGIFNVLVWPLAVAGVLALVLAPVVDFMVTRLHIPRVVAIAALFLVFFGGLGFAATMVVPLAMQQVVRFAESAPDMVATWQQQFAITYPQVFEVAVDWLEGFEWSQVLPEFEDARAAVMSYVRVTIGMAFVPVFLYFALLSGDEVKKQLCDFFGVLGHEAQSEISYLTGLFVGYITGFFRGQLLIALIMAVMLAIGFTLIGLPAAILLGLFLGLLNIVPFLGVIIGVVTVSPVAYLYEGGGFQLVALALLVFAVVQFIESWLLTPNIMAQRSGLHPGIVVISVFFWGTALGGIIGMILAVPLSAFIGALWHHVRRRWMQEAVVLETG